MGESPAALEDQLSDQASQLDSESERNSAANPPPAIDASPADMEELPPIRVIPFTKFKERGEFPRFPEDSDLTLNIEEVDPSNSLKVFISHNWVAGYDGAKDWRGRPHPDYLDNSKFELCCKGLRILMFSHGEAFPISDERCYIWIDFGCIDQDGDPAGELKQLDKIIQWSDMIFTPIVEKEKTEWYMKPPGVVKSGDAFSEYKAPTWCDGPYAYLNRAWCRVEMFYAAFIPLRREGCMDWSRSDGGGFLGLKVAQQNNRRLHVVYGTYEQMHCEGPRVVPPLELTYLDKFNPLNGSITKESDRIKIQSLMRDLHPFVERRRSFVNSFNFNLPHTVDFQKHVLLDGTLYEGGWKNSHYDGFGKLVLTNSDTYEGGFCRGKFHGYGVYHCASLGGYEGQFREGKYHGKGKIILHDGQIFEGSFKNNKAHGFCKQLGGVYGSACDYCCWYVNGHRHGFHFYFQTNPFFCFSIYRKGEDCGLVKSIKDEACRRQIQQLRFMNIEGYIQIANNLAYEYSFEEFVDETYENLPFEILRDTRSGCA